MLARGAGPWLMVDCDERVEACALARMLRDKAARDSPVVHTSRPDMLTSLEQSKLNQIKVDHHLKCIPRPLGILTIGYS